MAELAKESSTMRRVLDPMFGYFDSGRHWVPQQGLAIMVLSDVLYFMDSSGIFSPLRLLPQCVRLCYTSNSTCNLEWTTYFFFTFSPLLSKSRLPNIR